jgi:quinolinate synthase
VDVREKIEHFKRERNALILSHFYEDGNIQDIADGIGDSLYLAQVGEKAKNPVILLAGVVFMGESVKILSPDKTVLIPDMNAGCSLVHHSPHDKWKTWREKHPDGICVTYINSSAEVKALSDVICTSSNAEKIINSIPKDRPILFGPDKNLGRWLSKKLNREMILWPGACEVHILFSARKLFALKEEHPGAPVLAHPECEDAVLQYADVIGSTSRLLEEVKANPAKEFIIVTEAGIMHQMQKARPDARLIPALPDNNCACNECPYMKLNTLEKIAHALETMSPQIELPAALAQKAKLSLTRMMKLTNGETVTWPTQFHS